LPALHLIFGLVVEYPYTCPISWSQLPTTLTTTSPSP
jgi:hypothetical protein